MEGGSREERRKARKKEKNILKWGEARKTVKQKERLLEQDTEELKRRS